MRNGSGCFVNWWTCKECSGVSWVAIGVVSGAL